MTRFHLDLAGLAGLDDIVVSFNGRKSGVLRHDDRSRAALRAAAPHLADRVDAFTHFTETELPAPPHLASVVRATAGFGGTPGKPWRARAHAKVMPGASEHVEISHATTAWGLVTSHLNLATKDPATTALLNALCDDPDSAVHATIYKFAHTLQVMGDAAFQDSKPVAVYPGQPDTQAVVSVLNVDAYEPLRADYAAAMQATLNAVRNRQEFAGRLYRVIPGQPAQAAQSLAVAGSGESGLTPVFRAPSEVSGITFAPSMTGAQQLTVALSNVYQRWLGLDVTLLQWPAAAASGTGDGAPQPVESASIIGNITQEPYCQPCGTYFGIADSDLAGTKSLAIDLSGLDLSRLVGVNVYACSLGSGADATRSDARTNGDVLTVVFNLLVPAIFLMVAVNPSTEEVEDIWEDVSLELVAALLEVLGEAIADGGFDFSVDTVCEVATGFWKLLVKESGEAIAKLSATFFELISEEEAKNAIAGLGEILAAVAVMSRVSQLVETAVQIAMSDRQVVKTFLFAEDVPITVRADRINGMPPAPAGTSWSLQVIKTLQSVGLLGGQRGAVAEIDVANVQFADNSQTVTFPSIATDGSVLTFEARLVATLNGHSWTAARGATAAVDATVAGLQNIVVDLTDVPVPLTKDTTYRYAHSLAYDVLATAAPAAAPGYLWHDYGSGSTVTREQYVPPDPANQIVAWSSLDFDRCRKQLVMCYFAAGTGIGDANNDYGGTVNGIAVVDLPVEQEQDVDVAGSVALPVRTNSAPIGFTTVATTSGVATGQPTAYLLDPAGVGQGSYDLRGFSKGDGDPYADFDFSGSYGRFPVTAEQQAKVIGTIADLATHPEGHVVAVDGTYGRLYVMPAPTDSMQPPMAYILGGPAQYQDGQSNDYLGLMAGPVAISVSGDGIVFVLEAGQRDGDNTLIGPRVQAWDVYGNPSSMFYGGGANLASAILSLDPARAYVDICAIGTQKAGFLYIASGPLTAGADPTGYRIEVIPYGSAASDNAVMITLSGVPAARIAVDDLHQLYVMEYAMTQDKTGRSAGPQVSGASGPLGRTVPRITKYYAYDPSQQARHVARRPQP